MVYIEIYILSIFFFSINGLYRHFNWEDLPKNCGTTIYDTRSYSKRNYLYNRARIGEFPWLARIGLHDENTGVLFFYCTGSLIHEHYVITAAHCGKYGQLVRLGETNLLTEIDCFRGICAPPPQDIPIKKFMFAEHCRLSNTNDLSILVLENPVKFNDFVRPICFPRDLLPHNQLMNEVMIVAGWSVVYSGWGTVHGTNFTSVKDLKYIFSNTIDLFYCYNIYNRKLEDSELCVGYSQAVVDACVADSGGPIVKYVGRERRAYIVGVASKNLLICNSGRAAPAIFTDVSYFGQWILTRINQWIQWKS